MYLHPLMPAVAAASILGGMDFPFHAPIPRSDYASFHAFQRLAPRDRKGEPKKGLGRARTRETNRYR